MAALAPTLAVARPTPSCSTRPSSSTPRAGRPLRGPPPRRHRSSVTRPQPTDDSVALARERQLAFSRVGRRRHRRVQPGGARHRRRRRCCGCTSRDAAAPRACATAWLVLGAAWPSCCSCVGGGRHRPPGPERDPRRPPTSRGTSRALAGGRRATPEPTSAGPPEIADVAEALNLLADRIDELRAAERERVADLSHRLRTPLTALRLDAEAARRRDADRGRRPARGRGQRADPRRPAPAARGRSAVRCDLAAVAADRAAFWGALADDDGRAVDLHRRAGRPAPRAACRARTRRPPSTCCSATCSPTRRTARRYAVSVRGRPTDRVELVVEDGGPGIADADAVARPRRQRRRVDRPRPRHRRPPRQRRGRRAPGRAPSSALGGARVVLDLPARRGRRGDPGRRRGAGRDRSAAGRSRSTRSWSCALYDARRRLLRHRRRAGRRGDFLTSPEVGPALRRGGRPGPRRWWDEAGAARRVPVVEAGAGPGHAGPRRARRPSRGARAALRYVLVERSARPAGAPRRAPGARAAGARLRQPARPRRRGTSGRRPRPPDRSW